LKRLLNFETWSMHSHWIDGITCLTQISLKALKSKPSSGCLEIIHNLGVIDQEIWVLLST